MSFSCPHFQFNDDACSRVQKSCVPGRPGCVLHSNSVFVIPVEERLKGEESRDPGTSRRPGGPNGAGLNGAG
jgi:hypothetical protein